MVHCPGEASGGASPADTFISDFGLQDGGEDFSTCGPPGLCCLLRQLQLTHACPQGTNQIATPKRVSKKYF